MVDFSSIKSLEIPEGVVKSISRNGIILWKLSSRLPSEYQEVEYIQGTGTQYLDTGFVLNQGMLARYTLNYPVTTTNASIISSHNLTSPYGRNGAGGYNFNSYANGWELGYEGAYYYSYPISLNTMYSIDLSTIIGNAYIKVNGSVLGTRTETVTLSSNNVYIFANSYAIAHNEQKTIVKLYSLKLYDNSLALIGDYVPCYRKSDEEIGLYNLVDGNFLTNQGTGIFLKGVDIVELPSQYQPVEYIQSSGTQYINTDFKPDGKTEVEAGIGNITTNSVLFGAYNSDWTTGYGMYCNTGQNFWYHYYSNTKINMTPPTQFVMKFGKGKTYIDNVEKASVSEKTFTLNYPLYLFAGNWQGSRVEQPTSCKLYYAKIYDDGVLINHYVPCYNKNNNVVGLYDVIKKEFKTNQGTGTFLKGRDIVTLPNEYQEVEYIQSDGNQYIDTEISGNDIGEYEIKLNALGSQAHSWEQYFAGDRSTGSLTGKLYCSSSNVVYQGYPTGSDIQLGSISNTLEIKVLRSTGIVSNDVYKSAYSGAPWGTLTFWIFNSHSEPTLGSSMRLYYLKMYSNGELVRDYIPCYRKSDNIIGLYDLVSKTFNTNQGSGSFTRGGDI